MKGMRSIVLAYWVTAFVRVDCEICYESSEYQHTRHTLIIKWAMRRLTNLII